MLRPDPAPEALALALLAQGTSVATTAMLSGLSQRRVRELDRTLAEPTRPEPPCRPVRVAAVPPSAAVVPDAPPAPVVDPAVDPVVAAATALHRELLPHRPVPVAPAPLPPAPLPPASLPRAVLTGEAPSPALGLALSQLAAAGYRVDGRGAWIMLDDGEPLDEATLLRLLPRLLERRAATAGGRHG